MLGTYLTTCFFSLSEFFTNSRSLVQLSLVAQSCPTLCDLLNCSTPGLPVHHQLLESTQTHVHWVGDAIQPSHPLSSPFSFCPQSFSASGSFQMSSLEVDHNLTLIKLVSQCFNMFRTAPAFRAWKVFDILCKQQRPQLSLRLSPTTHFRFVGQFAFHPQHTLFISFTVPEIYERLSSLSK